MRREFASLPSGLAVALVVGCAPPSASPPLGSTSVSAPRSAASSSPDPEADALLTSQLVLRDRMLDAMTPAQRAYAGASALGQTQAEIASAHGVTQPAVSQSLRRSGGAAVAASLRLLQEVAR